MTDGYDSDCMCETCNDVASQRALGRVTTIRQADTWLGIPEETQPGCGHWVEQEKFARVLVVEGVTEEAVHNRRVPPSGCPLPHYINRDPCHWCGWARTMAYGRCRWERRGE